MNIQIRVPRPSAGLAARIRRLLVCSLRRLRLPEAEVSVLVTSDAAVRALNRRYRGMDRTTDILSFGMREQRRSGDPLPPDTDVLGDLVISWPQVKRQAKARAEAAFHELDLIVIHGLLHLLGYDHARRAQALRMRAMETALLAACRAR